MIIKYFDYFSYWVLAWFILYYFGLIDYNPTLGIFICLFIILVLTLIWFSMHKITEEHLVGFVVSNGICKIVPLILLWARNDISITTKDAFFTIGLYLVYQFYLLVQGKSFTNIYMSLYKKIRCI